MIMGPARQTVAQTWILACRWTAQPPTSWDERAEESRERNESSLRFSFSGHWRRGLLLAMRQRLLRTALAYEPTPRCLFPSCLPSASRTWVPGGFSAVAVPWQEGSIYRSRLGFCQTTQGRVVITGCLALMPCPDAFYCLPSVGQAIVQLERALRRMLPAQ